VTFISYLHSNEVKYAVNEIHRPWWMHIKLGYVQTVNRHSCNYLEMPLIAGRLHLWFLCGYTCTSAGLGAKIVQHVYNPR